MAKLSYAELERLNTELVRKAEEFYKSFFEDCHSVMLVVGLETGAILDANIAARDYYGYTKSEFTRMKITQINTLSQQEVLAAMQEVIKQKKKCFNFQHRLANGEIRAVEVFSGPIVYNGTPALYSIVHDISERNQMQEQIMREKQFSESLINSLPGIMYMFDMRDRFVRWNKNFETVTQYTPNEIKTMHPIDFIVPADKEKVAHASRKVYKKGGAQVEACLQTKAGRAIPYFFTGVRFVLNEVTYLIGVGIDITENRQAEEENQQLIEQLQTALNQVKKLSGFLPICAACKKIRDDKGYWNQIEAYIRDHSEAEFSHSICPECAGKLYPFLR